MKIRLNGKTIECRSARLMELVLEMGLVPSSVVAEVNLAVVAQEKWESTRIKNGDEIELLSFVGGG
ncbi:MAG: sulfur carrier protein ThiS [Desulfotignum sp.]